MKKIELYKQNQSSGHNVNIPLGVYALVDDEDYDTLLEFRLIWRLGSHGYAQVSGAKDKKSVAYLMHRIVTNAPDNFEVDHIDFNRLNNQKKNLRIVTPAQNRAHQRSRTNSASKYLYVYKYGKKKWIAQHKHNTFLGIFDTEQQAYMAILEFENGTRKAIKRKPLISAPICPQCLSKDTVGNGYINKKKNQRFLCNECGKTWVNKIDLIKARIERYKSKKLPPCPCCGGYWIRICGLNAAKNKKRFYCHDCKKYFSKELLIS